MKKQLLLSVMMAGALMLTGCGPKNPEDCQKNYNSDQEKSVKKYEDCSREKCANRVVELGTDACANECADTFKKEKADQDAKLAECLAKTPA